MDPTGAYSAERAAALSGVPRRTIYHWATHGIVTPSVSAEREKLWSFADLMALRIVHWLRRTKAPGGSSEIPASSMPAVRHALHQLATLDIPVWSREEGCSLLVDRGGTILINRFDRIEEVGGQAVAPVLDVVGPFDADGGIVGPDLLRPRPTVRIVPGRLSGSPHVIDTRLETRALGALRASGADREHILRLYPYLTAEQLDDALSLESQLEQNLRKAA